MNIQEHYLRYRSLVDDRLRTFLGDREPASLYVPTQYILSGKGKRVRAVLVMLAAEAVGGAGMDALDAGVGVEILHNFTLVHDDIMDRAATRRGRATVHTKWDEGTAILVGDVMIGLAYDALLAQPPHRTVDVVRAFTRGIVDVCEGQSMDRDFETRPDVTLDDYMRMIAMKTGRLLETAAEVGGIIGGGGPEHVAGLRAYARHVGLAFQIQDDLLDITAEEAEFGKRIGGDVIEGKKTYLFIRANERVEHGEARRLLDRFLDSKGLTEDHVPAMRDLYEHYGVLEEARSDVRRAIASANNDLMALPASAARDMLVWFAEQLMTRSN